nr:hypothetical protein [Tanacetum cinerariifolium]
MVDEQVILEEPARSTGTLSSLQHLAKDFNFGDLFFNDKPSETENEKTTTETEAESMMSTATKTTMTTTTHPPPPQPQQSTIDSILIKRIDKLDQIMANLIQDNKHLEERLDSHGSCLYILENLDIPQQRLARSRHERDSLPTNEETNSYKAHEDHMMLYEDLEKSINHDHTDELQTDLAKARKNKKKRHDSLKTPPGSLPHQPHPPPPPVGPSGTLGSHGASGSSQLPPSHPPLSTSHSDQSKSTAASSSSKIATSAKYTAWKTTDTRLRPNAHIPKVNLQQDWWKPLEEDRPATPEPAWSIPSSDLPVPTNNWASALASTYTHPPENLILTQTGPTFELVKVFHPNVIHLQYQMEECHKLLTDSVDESIISHNVSKPLPLAGPPGQVTIQSDFFFNKDLEYLRYGNKGGRPALSISKIKAAYYPDVGLEKWCPIRCGLKRNASMTLLLCHLNHLSPKDKKILTTTVNLWTRHLVIRQRVKDFQLGIESYQNQLNFTKPRWDATGFEYKHDFMVIDSQRAVTFRGKYEVQMIMRFNEIHKFSDDTLHQIDEALDYQVKEFKVNRMNPGLNIRFWTRKYIDRSKEFMFAIQKRLKTRRIFCNLESFIGCRVREGDYRLLQ